MPIAAIAATKGGTGLPMRDGKPKYTRNSCTSSGVPLMKSTYAPASSLTMRTWPTLAIPTNDPITRPIATAMVANSTVSLAPASRAGMTPGIIEKSRFTRTPPYMQT